VGQNVFKKAAAVSVLLFLPLILLLSPSAEVNAKKRFNMSYIYFGDSSEYLYLTENANGSLDEISPNYFNVDSDGKLVLTTALDTGFVKKMHEKGIKVVPFISNHWDIESGKKALENRKALTQDIADAVAEYDLDGINVDIEGLNEKYRSEYTDFVRLLRNKLPQGKTIAVSVASNPWGTEKGWQGSYDYEALSKYSDYLMIMAYDEHYGGSEPGPVAGAAFVESSIKYALKKVPKEKLVLGIPFYGRYWQNGASYGGYGISLRLAKELVAMYNGKAFYDKRAQSAMAVVTIKSTDPKPYVSGRKLQAGTYTIWYETDESIKYKLSLVQKYDLKGTGSWSLGQETPETWKYYRIWLNGHYFKDVQGHWAQEEIISAKESGFMKGISETLFAPDNQLTRAEAAAVLVRALSLEGAYAGGRSFTDTVRHWAEKEIEIARQNNLVLGTGNGKFEPDRPVTREEMAVMLDRLIKNGVWQNEGISYEDVDPGRNSWSYDSIIRLSGYGIFKGSPDGLFRPGDKTTRAQMAVLITRIQGAVENGNMDFIPG